MSVLPGPSGKLIMYSYGLPGPSGKLCISVFFMFFSKLGLFDFREVRFLLMFFSEAGPERASRSVHVPSYNTHIISRIRV